MPNGCCCAACSSRLGRICPDRRRCCVSFFDWLLCRLSIEWKDKTMADKTILVLGITGQQGGAVARHLLAKGWKVRGLSRDLSKPAVQARRDAGAEMVQGDMDDRASLDAALNGAYGVFSVQNFWLPGVGTEGEIRQG